MVELAKLIAFSLIVGAADVPCAEVGPVHVSVVVVLASSKHTTVDPKLAGLAREVNKSYVTLTGFTIHGSAQKSLPLGGSHTFELPEGRDIRVTIEKPRGPDNRIGLTVRLPNETEVTYACVCNKYAPVNARYKTRAGEVVIVAVMARPCTGK